MTSVDWRLTDPGRQLDANLVRLSPAGRIDPHVEPDLDVLVVVVEGGGAAYADGVELALEPGSLVWLPRGAHRSVQAGPEGLGYLTLHQRRPGMWIKRR